MANHCIPVRHRTLNRHMSVQSILPFDCEMYHAFLQTSLCSSRRMTYHDKKAKVFLKLSCEHVTNDLNVWLLSAFAKQDFESPKGHFTMGNKSMLRIQVVVIDELRNLIVSQSERLCLSATCPFQFSALVIALGLLVTASCNWLTSLANLKGITLAWTSHDSYLKS